MRAIDSTLILAERLQQPVTIYWPINSFCGAPFSALFKPIDNLSLVELDESLVKTRWINLRNSVRFRLAKFRSSGIYLDCLSQRRIKDAIESIENSKRYRHIMLKTDHAFMYPERFTAFAPVQELANRIANRCQSFSADTIGLHIRRGDHTRAIERSPLEGFELSIQNRLDEQPNSKFFLCTDCQATRKQLVDCFGETTILSNEHELKRESRRGIEDAIVELWSLSRCVEIWGSLGSSFSETAFHLSGRKTRLRFIEDHELVDN